jgi:putative Mg2+ transporter-C (MgtC) family protein
MPISLIEVFIRLAMSAGIGAAIGYEREHMSRPAGLRTNMMVCIGSALITMVSMYALSSGDPGRIAAGIVTGIGFLGAGTIFKNKDQVVGLTTAATLWTVAALGMAVGAGFYLPALMCLPIIFIVLFLNRFEGTKKYKKTKLSRE